MIIILLLILGIIIVFCHCYLQYLNYRMWIKVDNMQIEKHEFLKKSNALILEEKRLSIIERKIVTKTAKINNKIRKKDGRAIFVNKDDFLKIEGFIKKRIENVKKLEKVKNEK